MKIDIRNLVPRGPLKNFEQKGRCQGRVLHFSNFGNTLLTPEIIDVAHPNFSSLPKTFSLLRKTSCSQNLYSILQRNYSKLHTNGRPSVGDAIVHCQHSSFFWPAENIWYNIVSIIIIVIFNIVAPMHHWSLWRRSSQCKSLGETVKIPGLSVKFWQLSYLRICRGKYSIMTTWSQHIWQQTKVAPN